MRTEHRCTDAHTSAEKWICYHTKYQQLLTANLKSEKTHPDQINSQFSLWKSPPPSLKGRGTTCNNVLFSLIIFKLQHITALEMGTCIRTHWNILSKKNTIYPCHHPASTRINYFNVPPKWLTSFPNGVSWSQLHRYIYTLLKLLKCLVPSLQFKTTKDGNQNWTTISPQHPTKGVTESTHC